mgnify:CR=1 FL=1
MTPTRIVEQFLIVVFVLLAMTLWLLGKQTSSFDNVNVSYVLKQSNNCETGGRGKDTFTLFLHDPQIANELMQRYCDDPEIAKQFAYVDAHWGGGDAATIQYIGKGLASLALVKKNIIDALHATKTHGYKAVATYPNYKAYLIGKNERPKLSKEYLLDKKIALLEYPTSRSGHIIPKGVFTGLGLSLEKLDITYTNSHQSSRELLDIGEVDIIASYWSVEDEMSFSEDYKLELQNEVAGTMWYLKLDKNNTVLKCSTLRILQELASSRQSSYYSNIQLIGDEQCQN